MPAIWEVSACNGKPLVRLDRAELRFDEISTARDRLECPKCSHQFRVPSAMEVTFAPRTALLRQLHLTAA